MDIYLGRKEFLVEKVKEIKVKKVLLPYPLDGPEDFEEYPERFKNYTVITQSLEVLDEFLKSDLEINVITLRKNKERVISKKEAKELRDSYEMDLRK